MAMSLDIKKSGFHFSFISTITLSCVTKHTVYIHTHTHIKRRHCKYCLAGMLSRCNPL